MAMRIALPSRKQLFKFAFTPQISGNFRSLSHVFLALVQALAHVLVTADLIEHTHPVFMGQMGGLEGLGRVMVDAGAKLEWKRSSLPQIIMYFAVALLLTLMIAVAVISVAQLFISVAMAQGTAADAGILTATNDKARDWLLCIFPTDADTPCPSTVEGGAQLAQLASAIASVLAYYSTGCMILAGIIVGYEVTAIVMETAKEGKVFGSRHNELWAPIRLVFAIALLTPLPNGFNSGQIAVVKFASWGSGFASNVWAEFVSKTSNADFLTDTTMATVDMDATIEDLVEKLIVAEVARQAVYVQAQVSNNGVSVGEVTTPWMGGYTTAKLNKLGQASKFVGEMVSGSVDNTVSDSSLLTYQGEASYKEVMAAESINLPLPDSSNPSAYDSRVALKVIFPAVKELDTNWLNEDDVQNVTSLAESNINVHKAAFVDMMNDKGFRQLALEIAKAALGNARYNRTNLVQIVSADKFWDMVATYRKSWTSYMKSELTNFQLATSQSTTNRYMTEWGWVGAGGWILQLSQRIQTIKAAVQGRPEYNLLISDQGQLEAGQTVTDQKLAKAAFLASAWVSAAANTMPSDAALAAELEDELGSVKSQGTSSDPVADALKDADALNWLLDYLKLSLPTTLGRSSNPLVALMDFGWVILGGAGTVLVAAAVAGADGFIGTVLFGAFVPIFTAGVLIAILFPLLPTIRFAFGMMSWVLAILEAVFAIPVVALAHLRTDGAGIMGPMGRSAYMLLLQIFVRPSLMVMGLIGGVLVFNVTIHIVNLLFLVALSGYPNKWGGYYIIGIASVFIYASMVITMANMCFKMIDMVPDSILRWIGGGGMSGQHDVSFVRGTMLTAAGTSGAMVKAYHGQKVADKQEAQKKLDIKEAENKEAFMEFQTRQYGDPDTGKMPVTPEEHRLAREHWGVLYDDDKLDQTRPEEERNHNLQKALARVQKIQGGSASSSSETVAPGESPLKGKGPEERELLESRSEGGTKIGSFPKTEAADEE